MIFVENKFSTFYALNPMVLTLNFAFKIIIIAGS